MNFRNLTVAAVGGLIASFSFVPAVQATGDVWVEGSYEFLNLPDIKFITENVDNNVANLNMVAQKQFVNDTGNLDGFRFDGGIANIPVMGGASFASIKGFFAWYDETTDLQCKNNIPAGLGSRCIASPLFDNPNTREFVSTFATNTSLFTTDRDVNHWGAAVEITQGPTGLKAGPAFRRIDQDTTITGRQINPNIGGGSEPFELTYAEDLETNYWGAFVGADGQIDLGGGWSLIADGEAGLYWADTDYSGSYVVTNAISFGGGPNVNQSLSLESDELAFIGTFKAALEKNFGLFKLAGFGRVEYISSAPDVAYNDLDTFNGTIVKQGPDDETRLGERYAYSASVGARVTVPMGGQ